MAEEQACLVRGHSDSENSSKLGSFGSISRTMAYTEDRISVSSVADGAGEPDNISNMATSPPGNAGDANESGELLDYNDSSVLEQFHEDALRQAAGGAFQFGLIIATSLAVSGASMELAAIPFILPSAEIELCILEHEKNWLVLIALVGNSLGALGWAPLGERLGRRRALISCLAVNAVFAAIAAVMPTYGTFMMARFCSAIGSGGITGTAFTYLGECLSRVMRRVILPVLAAAAGLGLVAATTLARRVLPATGADTLLEDREHFSAWHRYLLLCTLPIVLSLISLIWTQESPRYLLDVGREVDAMHVYQEIYKTQNILDCGRRSDPGDVRENDYRLGELSLPGKRRQPPLHHVRHSVKMFWQAFFQIFSNAYRSTTFSLGGVLLFTMAIQYYLSSYVPATLDRMKAAEYEAAKMTSENESISHQHYNETLENVRFLNVTFTNCTFRDLLMSHVQFLNCSFGDVALENIKTSYTSFEGCQFYNSTIIDTDMEVGRELDEWCTFNTTIVRALTGGCSRHADLTSRLTDLMTSQKYCSHGALIGALMVMLPHQHVIVFVCAACVLASPSIYLAQTEMVIQLVEASYRLLVTMAMYIVNANVLESYPANLRCTAHGLILSVAYMGSAVVRGVGDANAIVSAIACALFGAAATVFAFKFRMKNEHDSHESSPRRRQNCM